MKALRCLGLVLLLTAVLGAAGCTHKKGSRTVESYPCCTPVFVESCGCGCGCGGGMPVMSGGMHHGGGGGCGCGGEY